VVHRPERPAHTAASPVWCWPTHLRSRCRSKNWSN